MTLWWCRGCGMEDTQSRAQNACPTCGSALQVADLDWLEEGSEGEETVFELEPEPIERAAIVESLVLEGVRHRWETPEELVVADARADDVDLILDEVLGADTRVDDEGGRVELELVGDDADDDGDESGDDFDLDLDGGTADDGYEVLSHLYLATDALQKRREDEDVARFLMAAGSTLVAPLPFGIDEEVWADLQASARNVAAALELDVEAPVDGELKALHNQLAELV